MKAYELAAEGYYWYRDDGMWQIVWIEMGAVCAGEYMFIAKTIGDEFEVDIAEYEGEFRGPIEYPTDEPA